MQPRSRTTKWIQVTPASDQWPVLPEWNGSCRHRKAESIPPNFSSSLSESACLWVAGVPWSLSSQLSPQKVLRQWRERELYSFLSSSSNQQFWSQAPKSLYIWKLDFDVFVFLPIWLTEWVIGKLVNLLWNRGARAQGEGSLLGEDCAEPCLSHELLFLSSLQF